MEEVAMLAPFHPRSTVLLIGAVALVVVLASPALAPPGDLDTSFDGDGKVTTDFGASGDDAFGVAIQGDGKIVAAGGAFPGSTLDFALARYNPDGSLDPTFDTDGKVTTDFLGATDQANAISIQGDGKIVAAGLAFVSGNADFALARYNPDGSLDPTFDTDGKVTTDFGASGDNAFGVAIQADGKIVAAGSAIVSGNREFGLARYNPDGSLDPTFDTDGKVTTDVAGSIDEAHAISIQGDGKLVAAGRALLGSNADFALARYNPDGSLDPGFDIDGKVTTDVFGQSDEAHAISIQGDGRIVSAGSAVLSGNRQFALARYNPDGSLDPAFDTDGKVTTDFPFGHDVAFGLAIQADGGMVAAGHAPGSGGNADFALARYNSDGSLDTTFSGDGKVTTDFASSVDEAYAVAIQGNGRIVAAGRAFTGSTFDFALARYESDTADLAFSKTDPPGRVPTGRNMTYTLTVTNNGPDAAAGVTVTDQLPPSVTFVSATPSQGSCGESGGIVTCNLGTMGNGVTATVEIVVRPTVAGTITNTASVTSSTPDPNQGNNSDSENTSVCRITSRRSSIPCG
jgi:uncharacterized delta-60 repeat protein/uncharacterized repeat protein (TIGR01451 family)